MDNNVYFEHFRKDTVIMTDDMLVSLKIRWTSRRPDSSERDEEYISHGNPQVLDVGQWCDEQDDATESVVDSEDREVFDTGAVRDTAENKPRPDLISPFALEKLGEWMRAGAVKYGPRNWEAGIPVSRTYASLYRHLLKFQQGDTSEDHLAAIFCNIMFIIHTQEMVRRGVLPKSLDDMPKYEAQPQENRTVATVPGTHNNGDTPIDYESDEEFPWKEIYKKL